MDFLVRIFGSAFSGHDFSVIAFLVTMYLLLCIQSVFLLTAALDKSEQERTPRWAWVTMVITPLVLGALGYGLYATS